LLLLLLLSLLVRCSDDWLPCPGTAGTASPYPVFETLLVGQALWQALRNVLKRLCCGWHGGPGWLRGASALGDVWFALIKDGICLAVGAGAGWRGVHSAGSRGDVDAF
jgi:hypothetical protein